jgi:hypothetical protein
MEIDAPCLFLFTPFYRKILIKTVNLIYNHFFL